jgi:Antitoxin-like ribbon-helix-helix
MTRKTDQGQDRNAWLDRLNLLRRTPQPELAPRQRPYPTPPSRKNRRVLTTWQDDASLKQLKMLAVELEVSQQSLVAEGLNYVLNKYGRPSVAT